MAIMKTIATYLRQLGQRLDPEPPKAEPIAPVQAAVPPDPEEEEDWDEFYDPFDDDDLSKLEGFIRERDWWNATRGGPH
jgi:hypothetical protein